ncbi:ParA family protein [Methylotenera sp.]|uniref:ParA family protein n=1 Tax=Methylotenera sp. TaxID=2051956 RepID=UPI002736759F|nr:ParA family protein [Methylotenera sp.]MDP3004710.1 ParA family protein [Methylotenera sp.]
MKTLYIGVQKGGVGKSTSACQLALYARNLGYRVLVIDFDDQGNTTKFFKRNGEAVPLAKTVTEVIFETTDIIDINVGSSGFSILEADGQFNNVLVEQARVKIEHEGELTEKSSIAHQHFANFLTSVDAHYDLCIIDGPPSLDIRVTIALTLADAVLSPIQLSQESIEGMSATLYGQRGVLNIKTVFNAKLNFLGFLPNMVEATDKHREALTELGERIGEHFLTDNEGRILLMPLRQSIRECQKEGIPIAQLARTNTMARSTWASMRKIFDIVLARLQLEVDVETTNVEAIA